MSEAVTMRIWRGDAEGGEFREYQTSTSEGEVVLDVIHRIQAEQANDLAVRWNCKAGKCGSCSAEVDGKPRLMCMTRMDLFEPDETITVAPLKTFPVSRDLVTDVTLNYELARRVHRSTRYPLNPMARTGCSRSTSTASRSFTSASSAASARTCAM